MAAMEFDTAKGINGRLLFFIGKYHPNDKMLLDENEQIYLNYHISYLPF